MIKTNALSNLDGTRQVPVDTVVQGTARGWAAINGAVATAALRDSFNVSSLTDNGTGDYTVTFGVAMPTANYSALVTGYTEDATYGALPCAAGLRSRAVNAVRTKFGGNASGYMAVTNPYADPQFADVVVMAR